MNKYNSKNTIDISGIDASLNLDVSNTYIAQGTLRPDLIESSSLIASSSGNSTVMLPNITET